MSNTPHPPRYTVASLPPGYFDLLPQEAVRFSAFPVKTAHNAVWDFGRGVGDTMYAALCGELGAALCVQLFRYFPKTGELQFCFDAGVETMAGQRAIPPSKLHTSIQPTRDVKVITTTHTTARSPVHSHWMFDSYYTHQWEGYAGSHVIEWDPERKTTRVLGMPVPRDSIYGALYDWKHHALWFTTFLKGHLWRLDLATRATCDLGQITEFGSYCLCADQRGSIYVSSRSGHLFHVNVDTHEITDLGCPADEPEDNPLWATHRVLAHHAQGPDGRLYLSFHFSEHLYAIDPDTQRIERTASFVPEDYASAPPAAQKGMAFDSRGVLWLTTQRISNVNNGSVTHLHRWDLLRGESPVCLGLVGTKDRATACVAELLIDNNDTLHLADSNHADDPPGILAIDLRKLSGNPQRRPDKTQDVTAYMLFDDGESAYPGEQYAEKAAVYQRTYASYDDYYKFIAEQANTSVQAEYATAVRLWELVGRGNAAVQTLHWVSDDGLAVWFGQSSVVVLDPEGHPLPSADPGKPPGADEMPSAVAAARLPFRQGRQHLATVSCWRRWGENQWLIGTRDGLLVRLDEPTGNVFSLGAIGVHGPIRQIATDRRASKAYGVSGDPMDLGHVFYFDDLNGLREFGRPHLTPPGGIICSNTQPTTVAVSPDGSRLAIGTVDDLACVYLFRHPIV